MGDDKVRENRLRRMAQRQGLVLQKSRRRDYRAIDYGMYLIVEPRRNVVATFLDGDYLTLDHVEDWLTTDPAERATSPLVEL